MFKEYFTLLLLGHILGDFYIQTNKTAKKKDEAIKWVFIHCICYWGAMMLVSLPVMSYKLALGATIAAFLHLIIDIAKYMYLTTKNKESLEIEQNIFFIDQLIHMFFLIVIAYWIIVSNTVIKEWNIVGQFFRVIGVSKTLVLSWVLALLIIHKPANIAIQKLLLTYKPVSKKVSKKEDNNAGRFIGTIERMIMLIFLSIGQYSAMGLVLTAKSIARYDRISKEEDFAEYYLLGTLISTVIVMSVSFVL